MKRKTETEKLKFGNGRQKFKQQLQLNLYSMAYVTCYEKGTIWGKMVV